MAKALLAARAKKTLQRTIARQKKEAAPPHKLFYHEEKRIPEVGYPVIIKRQVAKDILQVTGDKYRWYIQMPKKGEFHCVPSVSYVTDVTYPKGEGFEHWLSQHTVEEAARILQEAGDRGTRIHAAICHLILHRSLDTTFESKDKYTFLEGRAFSPREIKQLESFTNFWRMLKPAAEAIEHSFVNMKYGYGGTMDFLGYIDKGLLVTYDARKKDNGLVASGEAVKIVIDWKSGNNIYVTHRMQVAAYAENVEADYYGLVQLGTNNGNGFKLWWAKRGDKKEPHFKGFLNCLDNFNIYHGKEKPEILDLKTTLTLN